MRWYSVTPAASKSSACSSRDAKGKARAGTPREAAQEADAVLLAVHWSRIKDVLNQTGDWIYLLNFWTRTFNRTSAPVAGIRSDCTRTTIPCNALHSTSAKNSGFCRSELYSSGRAFCVTLPPHHVPSVSPILHRRRPALPDGWL